MEAEGGSARRTSEMPEQVGWLRRRGQGMDSAVTDSLSLELHAGVVSSLPRAFCELAGSCARFTPHLLNRAKSVSSLRRL